MTYYFIAPVKTLDCVADVIRWLRSIGCEAWQSGSTWEIRCIVPLDKVKQVFEAYNDNFGW
jgi:hypothetical protein